MRHLRDSTDPRDRLIVALDEGDSASLEEALHDKVGYFKITHSGYFSDKPTVDLIGRNSQLFLDFKLHDIPNTMCNAVRELVRYTRPSVLTVHTAAGAAALKRVMEIVDAEHTSKVLGIETPPTILGITVLTSLDAEAAEQIGLDVHGYTSDEAMKDLVVKRAVLANECGLDGVVCSPKEVRAVREATDPDFKLVVPGIRPAGVDTHDQARTGTPRQAILDGADYLVVGRAITQADDPAEAADNIVNEIAEALQEQGKDQK